MAAPFPSTTMAKAPTSTTQFEYPAPQNLRPLPRLGANHDRRDRNRDLPPCHDGILVKIEQRPDGFAKHFSCGHTQTHQERTLKESFVFNEHISSQQRLGPHSAESIAHSRGFGADAFVVSMQQEMYKDALHFLREARDNHRQEDADPFVTWRNLRAAILFSFAAIESCISQFIDGHVEAKQALMTQKQIDRWTEKDRFVSMNEKLKEGVELFGSNRLDQDPTLWRDYEELKDLRDALVHYKVANRLFYNTDDHLQRVEKGLRTAGVIIKRIYLSHPANAAYPKVFDDLP